MNDPTKSKVQEALLLVEQMLDHGEVACGLQYVRRLLHEAVTDTPDEDEVVELTAEPPCEQRDTDGRLRSIFLHRKTK